MTFRILSHLLHVFSSDIAPPFHFTQTISGSYVANTVYSLLNCPKEKYYRNVSHPSANLNTPNPSSPYKGWEGDYSIENTAPEYNIVRISEPGIGIDDHYCIRCYDKQVYVRFGFIHGRKGISLSPTRRKWVILMFKSLKEIQAIRDFVFNHTEYQYTSNKLITSIFEQKFGEMLPKIAEHAREKIYGPEKTRAQVLKDTFWIKEVPKYLALKMFIRFKAEITINSIRVESCDIKQETTSMDIKIVKRKRGNNQDSLKVLFHHILFSLNSEFLKEPVYKID